MKIAILFPGIGYNCDRPLLYYAGRLSSQCGYEVLRTGYTNLSKSIPEAFADAYAQTEQLLEKIDWNSYEDILFVSKSIGTAVAAAYAQNHGIACRNVYYTPLAQTFDYAPQAGIVFHGTSDPWAETAVLEEKCREHCLPLHVLEHANHSLELQTADGSCTKHTVLENLRILKNVMALSEAYIAHDIWYRPLCAGELCRELFREFIRRQNVVKCWRKENGAWVIKDDPFIDDWSEDDYQFLVKCLKNTVQTGGLVCGAFCGGAHGRALKGFVSVEPDLFGGSHGYLDLSCIHVSQDMRGKGIGKILFHTAKDWARKKGGRKLYISAHSAVETQAFYQAMGCVDAQEYNQHHVEQEPYDRQLECTL